MLSLGESCPGAEYGPEYAVLPLGPDAELAAVRLAHRLRLGGARVITQSGDKSLKSQMRYAGKVGVRYALILGENELAKQALMIRDMDGRRDYPDAVSLECSLSDLRRALANLAG
jgi:histidyl-tRNA synthetase